MATAKDLIEGSLRLLGVIAHGEAMTASEQADCLEALNQMIDSWSNERLLIHAAVKENFAFVASQQTYTMGDSGDFDTTRPQKIEQASVLLTGGTETPIKILNQAQWADVSLKSTQSEIPQYLFVEDSYPLTKLHFWPVPSNASHSVNIYSWKPLSAFASATDSVSLPPGYERALKYNLALEVAPEFGLEPSPSVVNSAMESKANIKRMNSKPHFLSADDSTRGGHWDYRTGDYR